MTDPRSITNDDETHALAGVLDVILPASADGRMPAASALGLAAPLREKLADAWPLIVSGLDACETAARARGSERFSALPQDGAAAVLEQVAAEEPAFLGSVIFHLYAAYYQHPVVVEALGLEARPPFPTGYPLEQGDLGQLERVRNGPRRYREC
ncbi:MAG: gluconate 2-dehydrogenase subunit 3 family protein [bacterium]|nr:gluconate 2-dehydrogenase subunit 3 family protein [bacterium]MCP5070174.1 gluconate 2-dehydrogenase subunit 3 family protein [bacterium]